MPAVLKKNKKMKKKRKKEKKKKKKKKENFLFLSLRSSNNYISFFTFSCVIYTK
jgi:hypothetical protein